jgi:hypothetical protein
MQQLSLAGRNADGWQFRFLAGGECRIERWVGRHELIIDVFVDGSP